MFINGAKLHIIDILVLYKVQGPAKSYIVIYIVVIYDRKFTNVTEGEDNMAAAGAAIAQVQVQGTCDQGTRHTYDFMFVSPLPYAPDNNIYKTTLQN